MKYLNVLFEIENVHCWKKRKYFGSKLDQLFGCALTPRELDGVININGKISLKTIFWFLQLGDKQWQGSEWRQTLLALTLSISTYEESILFLQNSPI